MNVVFSTLVVRRQQWGSSLATAAAAAVCSTYTLHSTPLAETLSNSSAQPSTFGPLLPLILRLALPPPLPPRTRTHLSITAVRAAVHVGDTPMDVRAALAGGAAALGVTTGAYDRHALQEAAADEDAQLEQRVVVLEDLSDLDHVLSVLQL